MIPLFTKPLSQLTAEDVEALRSEEVPEGQTVEFKQTLAARGGKPDPWLNGGSSLGEHARDDLLKEVVAFANSGGGNIVLGVVESIGHPKRAAGTNPLPRCHELAERLRLMSRDCIEPQLPSLEVWGVETSGQDDNAGVVLFRVPPSRLSPHRLKPTLQCYVRRADRTEKMTMQEIQDACVRLAQSGEAIETRLRESQKHYDELETPWQNPVKTETGIRVATIPVGGAVYIEKTYQQAELQPLVTRMKLEYDGWRTEPYLPAGNSLQDCGFRPVLRGAMRSICQRHGAAAQAIYSDGLVEFHYKNLNKENPIFVGWVLAMAANALLVADRVRKVGGAPGAELILDVELRSETYVRGSERREPQKFRLRGADNDEEAWSTMGPERLRLPFQSIGVAEEFRSALRRLLNDLENASQRPHVKSFDLHFA